MSLNLQPCTSETSTFLLRLWGSSSTPCLRFVPKSVVCHAGVQGTLSRCGGMVRLVAKASVACEKRRHLGFDSSVCSEGEGHTFRRD